MSKLFTEFLELLAKGLSKIRYWAVSPIIFSLLMTNFNLSYIKKLSLLYDIQQLRHRKHNNVKHFVELSFCR